MKKKVNDSFSTLAHELDAPKQSHRGLVLAALLTVGLLVVLLWSNRVNQGQSSSNIGTSSLSSAVFNWTEELFLEVPLGSTEEEIIAAYGAPDKRVVYPDSHFIQFVYESKNPETFETQSIDLSFMSESSTPRLHVKRAYNLPNKEVSSFSTLENVHVFTAEELVGLVVGDGETGAGGVTLSEVLGQFGPPTASNGFLQEQGPSIYNDQEGIRKQLTLFYQQPQSSIYQSVQFSFEAREKEAYRLSSKNATTR